MSSSFYGSGLQDREYDPGNGGQRCNKTEYDSSQNQLLFRRDEMYYNTFNNRFPDCRLNMNGD